jgi:hypothetical protein
MRKLQFLVALFAALGIGVGPACAWGDDGHKVVCEIAIGQVKPSTRSAIAELIRADGEFGTFSDACTWPDHPTRRAPEHFVNLSRDATSLTDECGVSSPCVVTAIAKDFAILSDKAAPQAQRAESLKFLAHWVGDVHQPLHVAFEDDRGGNDIAVMGECSGSLHLAWDVCLVSAAVGGNVKNAAAELASSIAAAQAQKWKRTDPRQWADESFRIAESAGTGYCVQQGNNCQRPIGGVRVDQAYLDANVPIVKEQLQKAGIRLADLLDRALAN